MSDIERLVASLISSPTPLTRDDLTAAALAIAPDVAPLADHDTVTAAVDEIVGLGPLERLLGDPDVSDVLVNGPGDVWAERRGALERTDVTFRSAEGIIALVRRLIAPLGLRIDRASPAVDARLPDGSRLHAVIPPAAVDGPIVAIRRFHRSVSGLRDLIERGAIDDAMAGELSAAVRARENILVAGHTGAGKTTLLNVLCDEIPPTERIVTIEDAAELSLAGHVVRLEARSANVEGAGGITIRELLRHALRLRPDRIVVGEVRGPEALDMLQALTTGHRGSMSTIHADGVDEALVRLETLAAMAPDKVPHRALSHLVAAAVDLVVVVRRDQGHRSVVTVERVAG
jgi:pilus assembly protein CpaF